MAKRREADDLVIGSPDLQLEDDQLAAPLRTDEAESSSGPRTEHFQLSLHEESGSDELIAAEELDSDAENSLEPTPPNSLRGLYISHFLSTWNARVYEFAIVVFTVEAFPNTLLPASISGISQCITSIFLSPSIGAWADRNPSRLNALKTTILVQRLAVLLACACWTALLWSPRSPGPRGDDLVPELMEGAEELPSGFRWSVLCAIITLSCVERLAAGGNMVVMERDWVPTLAPTLGDSSLHILNATMRRIDLICKVLAPGFVTLLPTVFSLVPATRQHSVFWSVVVLAGMSLLSPWVEWGAARKVWMGSELLQAPKISSGGEGAINATDGGEQRRRTWLMYMRDKAAGLLRFVRNAVFLPTVSISLMYLSVLTFSSPMITFLLNFGFSLPVVTVARLFSSMLEVSATAIMPWGVKTLRNRPAKQWRHVGEDEVGFMEEHLPEPTEIDKAEVERVGLWAVWWMTISLTAAVYGVTALTSTTSPNPHFNLTNFTNFTITNPIPGLPHPLFSLPMLLGVAFSRIGLWTSDLAYSQLQQTLPPPRLRGEFTGIEQSFIATSELLQWTLTAIMSRPEQFYVLGWVSWVAVATAAGLYALFIRRRRGHLLHMHVGMSCCKS